MRIGSRRNPARTGLPGAALGLTALLATGCFLEQREDLPPAGGPQAAPRVRCVELAAEPQRRGDSLTALANAALAGELNQLVLPQHVDWVEGPGPRLDEALGLYAQALAAAPGHCGALFGRSLAQGIRLLHDRGLNDGFDAALGKQGGRPLAQAFGAGPAEAAPLILRLASGLGRADKPHITAQQERIAAEVLPVLDSIVATLEAVMARPDFSVRFDRPEGAPVEFDKGDIGPVLGGLQVVKAVLLVLVGVELEVARDGAYAWMDRLGNLSPGDFPALRQDQAEDLDHLVSLFRPGSAFTRVKPAWKAAVGGIPALLLEAVRQAQDGLRYNLAEPAATQIHDLYRVGTGESADVDPADLLGVVDALERTRKYLTGEVAIDYRDGRNGSRRTLQVVFPKVFAWDGLQNHLPYFQVRDYRDWVVGSPAVDGDEWHAEPYQGPAHRDFLAALGLSVSDHVALVPRADGGFDFVLREDDGGWFGSPVHTGPDVHLATAVPVPGAPCRFDLSQTYGRRRLTPEIRAGSATFELVLLPREGVVDLGRNCRVETDGSLSFRIEDDFEFRSPFLFTDAAGNMTLDPREVDSVVQAAGGARGLAGKVVFRDPTFGGVFPGLTNANIWDHVESLDGVEPKFAEKCETRDGRVECRQALGSHPSDLDVWVHHLDWLDNLF